MATKSNTTNVSSLVINKVASAAVFASMVENDQVNENELYLVMGDTAVTYSISKSGGTITLTGSDGSTSTVTVPTSASDVGAIAAPASPSDGNILTYSSASSAWVASSLYLWSDDGSGNITISEVTS